MRNQEDGAESFQFYRISEEMKRTFRIMYGSQWARIPKLVEKVNAQKEWEDKALMGRLKPKLITR